MVSSMEEFFRTVSVSQLFSLTPRCGLVHRWKHIRLYWDWLRKCWDYKWLLFYCKEWLCPKRATYANPENTYSYMWGKEVFGFSWRQNLFLGTNQSSMTTSGIEHMDGIWSGRIFLTYVHQASHPISSLALTSKLDEILFWSLKHYFVLPGSFPEVEEVFRPRK